MLVYEKGELCWDGIKLSSAAKEWGTPMYIYNRSVLEEAFLFIQSHFTSVTDCICYALKANSNPVLVECLAELGAGADIVSMGELIVARQAKVPPEKIVFSGVGKTEDEIQYALKERIGAINIESEQEILCVNNIAAGLGIKAPVMLRVNPDVDPQSHPYISTGMSINKFGIPIKSIPDVVHRCVRSTNLEFLGLHVHIGSQIEAKEPVARAFKVLAELVDSIEKQGTNISIINLGGGLPVDYAADERRLLYNLPPEKDLDEGEVVKYWADCIQTYFDFKRKRIIIEPGRAITAHAGILLTKILYTKRRNNKEILIVDAGINDFIRTAFYGAKHGLVPLREPGKAEHRVDIVGPLCETGDYFALDLPFPQCKQGDYIAILSTGAYGFVSTSNYNMRCRPPELLIDKGTVRCIRPREKYSDIIKT